MGSRAKVGTGQGWETAVPKDSGASRGMGTNRGDTGAEIGGVYVILEARTTNHFLRRLEERGGDLERLVLEGDRLAAAGWLRPVHRHDYDFIVPGFGQIRLRLDRRGRGFVAVTFLPRFAC